MQCQVVRDRRTIRCSLDEALLKQIAGESLAFRRVLICFDAAFSRAEAMAKGIPSREWPVFSLEEAP